MSAFNVGIVAASPAISIDVTYQAAAVCDISIDTSFDTKVDFHFDVTTWAAAAADRCADFHLGHAGRSCRFHSRRVDLVTIPRPRFPRRRTGSSHEP
mmetsp:Transcript_37007/g.59471  ORF Transcript_37007/g.59471 Transcript_37007/m.59471 type:complete len:97 (+) Transcript_37007:174-464(+)